MKVMWLDPGITTGWAYVRLPPVAELRGLTPSRALQEAAGRGDLEVGQIECRDENAGAWACVVQVASLGVDVLGMEDFRLFPDMIHGPDPDGTAPDRMIARIEQLLWLEGSFGLRTLEEALEPFPPKVVKQMPGERTVIKDEQLRRWGLWVTKGGGGGPHAMDALRHLIVFLRKLGKGD